jgi:hypothetical protein
VRLDHLLSRELISDEPVVPASWPHGVPECRPDLEPSPSGARLALLSFERPAAESPRLRPRRTLKTAQLAKQRKITVVTPARSRAGAINDHRQDSKGTRWMPWHQESKKGVDGCDKPR